MTETTWGGKGSLQLIACSPPQKEAGAGTRARDPEAGAEAENTEGAAYWLAQQAFYTT